MTTAPAITVLMPVYNAAAYVAKAVQSTLDQSFTDFELLIIHDASSDDSSMIIGSFDDPRIRIITHEKNMGLVASLNDGLDHARGRYIARMDADDMMLPQRLEKQFRYLEEHEGIGLVATFVDLINPDGAVTGEWDTDREAVTEEEIRAMMPRTTCIAHPSVMIRRSALGSLRYEARMVEGEDWDLWLRMLSRGLRIAKIPETLLLYRQHPHSFTGAARARRPLELRLLVMRRRFLQGEWSRFRFSRLHLAVLKAQFRSVARHIKLNVLPPLLRNTYRVLTYSPVRSLRERSNLRRTLAQWNGQHVFLFPYLNMGGAEQVHADIAAAIADKHPLVIMCGFSSDRAFADRFAKSGTLLEIPRLLNHPWTRKAANEAIARKLNGLMDATLLSSMTTTFFDLLPLLKREVRSYYMLHAFRYQPGANLQQKTWVKHFDRIDRYLFPSGMALSEFDKFLFHENIPALRSAKLLASPCAVPLFGEVREHQRTGILMVGRDSPEKRLDLFLLIAAELERKLPGRFRFTVAGAVHREGHPHVAFKGIIGDAKVMSALYSDHDLLVLTSTREGFSLVVMEAMANGLVVLSTPVGDVPGRVDPSSAFITTSVEATVVLREMTAEIAALDADRDRLLRTKVAALARARADFDTQTFRERYRALLIGKAST